MLEKKFSNSTKGDFREKKLRKKWRDYRPSGDLRNISTLFSPRRSPPQLYPSAEPKNPSKNRDHENKLSAKIDAKKIKQRESVKERPIKTVIKNTPAIGGIKKSSFVADDVKDIKEKSKHKKEDRRKGTV